MYRSTVCVIGISGYSGSGKTTLIRKLIPLLRQQGLAVGVLKHSHHELSIDRKGKDTDHFFRAGADLVLGHDAAQGFIRFRKGRFFPSDGRALPIPLDLLLVEGHKGLKLPGIRLEEKRSSAALLKRSAGARKVLFRDDRGSLEKAFDHIMAELASCMEQGGLYAGLLVGGASSRMGSPKSLLKLGGKSMAARAFGLLSGVSDKTLLLGSGPIPASLGSAGRLADLPSVEGPLAGMLSAFRWAPDSAWLISSVDMPLMRKEAWQWLLGQRRPGVWAVLPKIRGSRGVETTGSLYEPMIFGHIEWLARQGVRTLQKVAGHPKVISPVIPDELADAWQNVNTPNEWNRAVRNAGRVPVRRRE